MSSVREKKEEYVAAPAVVGETAILASCLPEHATRYSVTLYSALCTLYCAVYSIICILYSVLYTL